MEKFNNNDSKVSKQINEVNNKIKDEISNYISVSQLKEFISEYFDSEQKAKECAEKGLNNPNYKYYNMTAEEILEQWNEKAAESKAFGNFLDEYAGLRLNNKDKELGLWKLDNNFEYNETLKSLCKGFDEFIEDLYTNTNYRYVSREMPVYIKSKNGNYVKGRFDCLFYDENTDAYIIIDWKTNEEVKLKNSFNKLKGPAYFLDDCDGNKFTIQLQLYKKALDETYHLTNSNKISIYICQMLRTPNNNNKFYNLIGQTFNYNIDLLDKLIDFATEKNKILNS